MAVDRRAAGLVILRICIGLFFIFEGLGKIRWFPDTSILASRLAAWGQTAAAGSITDLQRVASLASRFARPVRFSRSTASRWWPVSGRRCSHSWRSSWR